MESPQAVQQPRLTPEPMDAGEVVLVMFAVVVVAVVGGSIYLACNDEARLSLFGFVALFLRELVLLALLAIGLLIAAAVKVLSVANTWFRGREKNESIGENAL